MGKDYGVDRDELLAAEETMLKDISGVAQSMDTITEYRAYAVARNGKRLFTFRLSGLDDEEMERCRTEATKYVKSKRLGGITVPADFNAAKFNSLLIVAATHPEDRAFLWDNKELREKAGVLSPWQMVDKVLRAGEKSRAIDLIERLSGIGEDGVAETAKNL